MKRTHLLLTVGLLASAIVGCTPLQVREPSADMPMTEQTAIEAAAGAWTDPAVVHEGTPMMVLVTPTKPPASILERQIKLELSSGSTVHDVAMVLANLGHSVIIADKEAAGKEIVAPRYYGTLGGLFSLIERAADVWTVWENDALVFSSRERVAFTLPQERKLASRIATGLNDLGVCVNASDGGGGISAVSLDGDSPSRSTSSSSGSSPSCGSGSRDGESSDGPSAATWEAGMISLSVTPNEYRRVLSFLERITRNAAVVNLQVAMVSVATNQDVSRGIDWTKLQLAVGGGHASLIDTLAPSDADDLLPGSNPVPGTGGIVGGNQDSTPNTGEGALFHGGTLRGVVSNGTFSMIGFLDFLDNYGETKTLQSVMLRTVTGSEVELKSVTEIPYVSDVGVGALNYQNNSSGLLGSANTSTANDGITLRMLPSYDAASHTVTIDMSLAIEAVLAFNELSAGNQLGTLTQPTTAKRTFNDVIRVRPGQTVVVGGISYDQLQRDDKVPLYLPNAAGHKGLKVKRESMFIVVRPTVTVLGAIATSTEAAYSDSNKPAADTSAKSLQQAE